MSGSVVLTEGMRLPGTARGTVAWEGRLAGGEDRAGAHDRDRRGVAAERAEQEPGGMLRPYMATGLLFMAIMLP
eukprot:2946072-Rhodomonas_salina.1